MSASGSAARSLAYTPLACDEAGIAAAAEMLRAGRCVAFPTETVYGLGANALSEPAVRSIFAFKGRPLTDPLIVHVCDAAAAGGLLRLPGPRAAALFNALAARFWPGPLTLVARAAPCIPLAVTAGTGFVGVRVPAHPLARALLAAARVPVAAPSANRFGHVSPTRAAHVVDDLGGHPIGVLMAEAEEAAADGNDAAGTGSSSGSSGSSSSSSGSSAASAMTCGVGIESTVAKVEAVGPDGTEVAAAAGDVADSGDSGAAGTAPLQLRLVVFRRGGVSVAALRAALDAAGFSDVPIVFRTMHDTTPAAAAAAATAGTADHDAKPGDGAGAAAAAAASGEAPTAASGCGPSAGAAARPAHPPPAPAPPHADHTDADAGASAPIEGGSQAPGMLLSHYAPDVPTFLAVGCRGSSSRGASDVTAVAAGPADDDAFAALEDVAAGSLTDAAARLPPPADPPAPLRIDLRSAVVLDFGSVLAQLRPVPQPAGGAAAAAAARPAVLAYRQLSAAGDPSEAAAHLFEALRWAEGVPGARAVLLADPLAAPAVAAAGLPPAVDDATAADAAPAAAAAAAAAAVDSDALRDRMYRAASGRVVAVALPRAFARP